MVYDELDGDLKDIAKECTETVYAEYPEGSFQRIFWEQQMKASSVKD